jgi:hypothetical protein
MVLSFMAPPRLPNLWLERLVKSGSSLRRTSHNIHRLRIQQVSHTDLRASIEQLPTCSPAHCSLISLDPNGLWIDSGSISRVKCSYETSDLAAAVSTMQP